MHVVVCTKLTPDTTAKLFVGPSGEVGWGDQKPVVNPWDEYAIEEAIRLKEKHGGKATVLSMGDEQHKDALKDAVAKGCDEAILLWDPAFKSADTLVTARVLAAAIRKLGDVDVLVFGKQAIDGDTGVTGPETARILGYSQLAFVAKIRELDPSAKTITVERLLEEGKQVVRSKLPAAISVVKDINEPRYASFMAIRKAAKMAIPIWSAADLGLSAAELAPAVKWPQIFAPPPREVKTQFIQGATPEEQAHNLVAALVADKVI